MPADTAVLERALIVMAVCMAIQTLMCLAASAAAFIAWRRASAAVAEARTKAEEQVAELRGQLERVSATVDRTAQTLMRGSSAVEGVVTDVRDAMHTVKHTVGSVASVVTPPRAALALGLLQGVNVWRKRRAAPRAEEDITSEL
jgi:hypothetical protein